MEAARRLGERLLRETTLTAAQVRGAVEEARKDEQRERSMKRLRRLATQAQFAARLDDDVKRVAEFKRIVAEIMEVLG